MFQGYPFIPTYAWLIQKPNLFGGFESASTRSQYIHLIVPHVRSSLNKGLMILNGAWNYKVISIDSQWQRVYDLPLNW